VTEVLASKQAESWVSRKQNVCLPNVNNEEDAKAAASENDQEA
jgi:hypothetical protein